MKRVQWLASTLLTLTFAGACTDPAARADSTSPEHGTESGAGTGASSANRLQALVPWPDLDTVAAPVVRGGEHDAAVIVALESYVFVPPVPGALDNGLAWQRYFTQSLGVPADRVRILSNAEATKTEIEKALDRAATQAGSGGRVWFVFIGHGAPSRGGDDGLLLGADVQRTTDSLEDRSLRQSQVIAQLERSRAQPVIILDACFSGQTAGEEALCEGCQPVALAAVAKPERALVLSAARADQVAGPLPGRARPAFSYLVLGGLRGWADRDSDGSVTAGEVIDYANAALGAVVKGRTQTPELLGDAPTKLAASAGEPGPDLAEIQRILTQGGAVSFNGDGIVLTELPTLNLRDVGRDELAGEIDLSKIDMAKERQLEAQYLALQEAKRKVEAARAAGKDDPTGVRQEQAWCELAELPDPNPYRDEAREACATVKTYVEQRKRLLIAMQRDWSDKVVPFMDLQHRSVDDKLKVMQAFVGSYGVLSERAEVRDAIAALAKLERGEVPRLVVAAATPASTPATSSPKHNPPAAPLPASMKPVAQPGGGESPPDLDADGVPDDIDMCSGEPETRNGYQDADGCSDVLPQSIQILDRVTFASGSATISTAGKQVLDAIVAVLAEHPDVSLTITGNTDDREADPGTLAQQRASAVRDYLVGRGVAASRLTIEAWGRDRPLDTNKTSQGRANNRRVEFSLTR